MTSRSTIDNFSDSDFEYGEDGPQTEVVSVDIEPDTTSIATTITTHTDLEELRLKSPVNVSAIDVKSVTINDETEIIGGANPLDIPGNEYWADYWSHPEGG